MVDHVANRKVIIDQLRRELVGPDRMGDPIDVSGQIIFSSWDQYRAPHVQRESGDEILVDQTPSQRYGVGVLFPKGLEREEESEAVEAAVNLVPTNGGGEQAFEGLETAAITTRANVTDDASQDIDLGNANVLSPSTMAISFLVDFDGVKSIQILASGGRYVRQHCTVRPEGGRSQDLEIWLRRSVTMDVIIESEVLLDSTAKPVRVSLSETIPGVTTRVVGAEGLNLAIEVVSRPRPSPSERLLTVCLVNHAQSHSQSNKNEQSLFQAHFKVEVLKGNGVASIKPYPSAVQRLDEEQRGLDMLYRHVPAFATGHGCAADWGQAQPNGHTSWVSAECLPIVNIPPITPEIVDASGQSMSIGMAGLAQLELGDETWHSLATLVNRYEQWVAARMAEANEPSFPKEFRDVAQLNVAECEYAVARMRRGLRFLEGDPLAIEAFRLANRAMITQQVASRIAPRSARFDSKTDRIVFEPEFRSPDILGAATAEGKWRPFQIAFLLSSIESTGNLDSDDHELVDLIWFPTGGGKTEAYLGLAAFAMFLRRLRSPGDAGVTVLMRYTLRLLTTQQFERASSLICAMERIRALAPGALGEQSFSIGIWLGGDTTPNKRETAVGELKALSTDRDAENPFLVNRCPWCGATLGRVVLPSGKGKKQKVHIAGYSQVMSDDGKMTVVISCPDNQCPFHSRLPVFVVDEDVYATTPTMVIGTVDKFARLTWDHQPRRIFGIDPDGSRFASPPQLIIQDELHLISGPLGSLSGLLEPIIENLCTDLRGQSKVVPKIVCSTATTRRYQKQILGLYGRERVCLFPPPGLDARDSFFARTDPDAAGKVYVGVHAPGFGSYQTEWVRALTALINSPMVLDGSEARDPWWTLLLFCNSLRDMGTAHTLLTTDVLDYSIPYWQRRGVTKDRKRYISRADSVLELTGGLQRSQVKEALDALVLPLGRQGTTVDVCLATNIIEVGVDIPRLSLMAVAGQPKTTAQYIQATGRVGRSTGKPGLVVTLYGPSKPRDRSHFERFRTYHERLYAQVEPTSMTPFSPPALRRFLHSAIIAHVRQASPLSLVESPYPFPDEQFSQAVQIIRDRLRLVDDIEDQTFVEEVERIAAQWKRWERRHWERAAEGETALLRHAGTYATAQAKLVSWATMDSLRNVDAECHGEISLAYLNHQAVSRELTDGE